MRDPLIGTRINRYEIRESVHKSDLIGIYKAYDTKLERYVLIKTIIHSSDYSKEAVDFFLAESKSLAKLAHPNIAKALDFGYENGNLYLISEYIPGNPLSDLMNHPMPWQNAINLLIPLTNALVYAHSRGIIHRDLKPDNIIINTDDQPILSDFSLMRIIEEEETRDMTGTNVGLGSPEYISPEQGKGLPVDFRSDVYSLGVIFFEMVTGKKLFYATSSMEIVIQHIMADPPKPRSIIPTLPKMVETIILNALSKDLEKRYQTMEEFSNAMKAVVETVNREKNKPTRPRSLLMYSILGISLLLIGIGVVFRNRIFSSTSSTPNGTTAQALETDSATPRLITTPTPDSATQASLTLTAPSVSSNDPFSFYSLPAVPVLPGTKLPVSNQVIDASNAGTIQELARWEKPNINQLALINNDQVILAATSAGVYFFDPKDLSARMFFDTAGSLVAFTVSDDSEWVATADETGEIAVWNIADGKQLHLLTDKKYIPNPTKPIKSLAFSPDKSKLVFSDADKKIHYWNLEQNQYYPFKQKLSANANKVMFALEAGGDTDAGDTVISGGDENQIMVWDVPSGDLKNITDKLATSQKIYDMSLSADNRYAAVALNQGVIEIWDLYNKTIDKKIEVPESEKTAFTFITYLPNESNILTGSEDGFIRLWSISGSTQIWEKTSANQFDHPNEVNAVKTAVVSDNGTILVVGFADGLVEVWDLTDITNQSPRVTASKALGSTPIKGVIISADDQVIAYQGGNSFVKLLSIANDSQSAQISGRLPRGNPISPDSKMIGIIQIEDTKNIINLHSLSPTAPQSMFKLYNFPITASVNDMVNGSISYSPDNNMLTAFAGGDFKYWSTSSGLELKESLPKREDKCYAIYRQGKDGKPDIFIVAGSENGVIYSDTNLKYFCQAPRNPRTISEKFLPDGSIIALSLQNQLIEVWNANNTEQKIETEIKTPGDVLDVTISNNGKLLATASVGGAIEIYNLETMELIKILDLRTAPINQVLFSNDGKYIISGSSDGTLRFFGLYP